MKTNLCFSFVLLCLFGTALAEAASDPRWERTVSHSPVSVREGQYVIFYTMIEALQGAVSNLEIRGGVDSLELFNKTIPRLNRNQKMVISFRWKSKAGNHDAYFQIDPKRKVADRNRDNNRVQLSFRVSKLAQALPKMGTSVKVRTAKKARIGPEEGAALPDISIVNMIVYNPQQPSAKRNEFRRGDPINVEVTVKNIGQAPTGPFWMQLEVKSQEISQSSHQIKTKTNYEKQSVASLAPGKNKRILFALGHQHSPAYAIQYDFTATADYNKRVIEFDEDNNDRSLNAERRPQ